MKGETTMIVTNEQMNVVVNGWWTRCTYSTNSEVTKVQENDVGGFVITLSEIVKEKED